VDMCKGSCPLGGMGLLDDGFPQVGICPIVECVYGRVLHSVMHRCPNRVLWNIRSCRLKRWCGRSNCQSTLYMTRKYDSDVTLNLY
jgi:hypothetical protein